MPDHHDLFISYSRSADGRLAPLLQRQLQQFAKPIFRRRALRVFRDDDTLSANPALWTSIKNALDGSDHLLVLASPSSAKSEWVAKEIHHWNTTKPRDTVLLAVTDGAVEWDQRQGEFDFERSTAISPSLRGSFAEEPRYVDLRWTKEQPQLDKKDPRLRSVVADLAAPLHGRSKDELVGEDLRMHKRLMVLTWTAVAMLAVLTLSAVVAAVLAVDQRNAANAQRLEASRQRDEAEAQRKEADAQRLEASRQRDEAEAQRDEAERQAVIAQVRELSARSLAGSDPYVSLALSVQAELTGETPRPEARDAFARAVQRVGALPLEPAGQREVSHDARGSALAFSTDGALLVSGADDGTVRAWRINDHSMASELAVTGGVSVIEFAPADSVAAIGDTSGALWLWRPASDESASGVQVGTEPISAIAWSADGARLVIGSSDGTVWIADMLEGLRMGPVRLLGQASNVVALTWVEGQIGYIAQELVGGTVDPDTGEPLTSFALDLGDLHEGVVLRARFSPDGSQVATLGDTGTPVVWQTMTGTQVRAPFPASFGPIAWSPDARTFVSGSSELRVHELEIAAEAAFPPVPVHQAAVQAVAWSPDGTTVASIGDDGSVRWWKARTERQPLDYIAPADLLWSAAGDRIVGMWDGLWSWDIASAVPTEDTRAPGGELSPDGAQIAVHDLEALYVYDVAATSAGPPVAAAPGGFVYVVAWSHDGSLLATESAHDFGDVDAEPSRIRVWSVGAGGTLTEMASLLVENTDLELVDFTPDGSAVLLRDRDGLSVWDLEGEPVHVLDLDGAFDVTYRPDGQAVAVRGNGFSQIVDVATWTLRAALPPGVNAWSPDGTVIAIGGEQLGLYDGQTGAGIGDLVDVSEWGIDHLAWSPDGAMLAASGGLDPEVLHVLDSWSESEACALLADVFGSEGLDDLIGDGRTSVCGGELSDITPLLPVDLRLFRGRE